MALAKLTIDLDARLASLEQGLGRAVQATERSAKRMASAFDGTQKALTALGGVVAGAFSVSAIVQFTRVTVDGMDALNDFADAVGTTVEMASALEDVALRTGTSLDTVQAAAMKLNQTLQAAREDNEQARALRAIGLDAERLRSIDPAQALLEVAQALARYADDGNKARLIQVLFGKSAAEVAALLKDLAERGKLVATVTTEQAQQAERLNKQLSDLSANWTAVSRSILGAALPALNEGLRVLRDYDNLPQRVWDLINGSGRRQALRELLGTPNPRASGVLNGLPQSEVDAEVARLAGRVPLPTVGDIAPAARPAGGARAPRPQRAEMPPAILDAKQQYKADFLRSEREAYDAIERFLRDAQERARDLGPAILDPLEDAKSHFLQSEKEGYEATDKLLRDMEERAARVGDVAQDLGFTFASAFEDALVSGANLRELIRGLEQDIVRLITRKAVTEPLAEFVTGSMKGVGGTGGNFLGSLGNWFGSLFAGFFADGGYIPPGRWGVVGERGPEPAFGGRTGLTVAPAGAGMVVNNTFVIQGQTDRRTQQQIAAAAARAVERAALRNN